MMVMTGRNNKAVKHSARHLMEKPFREEEDAVLRWDCKSPVPQIQDLGRGERLYIVGHGTEDGRTLGGHSGVVLAELLAEKAKLSKNVQLISLVCCNAGAEPNLNDFWDLEVTVKLNPTFARSFHLALGEDHGIYTMVHARAGETKAIGSKSNFDPDIAEAARKLATGIKIVRLPGKGYDWKGKGSKFRYYWKDDNQMVEPVY